MLLKYRLTLILFASVFSFSSILSSDQFSSLYLQQFGDVEQQLPSKEGVLSSPKAVFDAMAKLGDEEVFGERHSRELTLSFLNKSKQAQRFAEEGSVIDNGVWKSLELFSGNQSRKNCLLRFVSRTQTVCGEIVLARLLSAPVVPAEEILQRQEAIRLLVENEEVFGQVEQLLLSIKESEGSLASFLKEKTLQEKHLFDSMLYSSLPKIDKFWNKNKYALELSHQYSNVMNGLFVLACPAALAWLSNSVACSVLGVRDRFSMSNHPHAMRSLQAQALFTPLFAYIGAKQTTTKFKVLKKVQKDIIALSTIVKNMKRLREVLEENKLTATFLKLDSIQALFEKSSSISEELKVAVNLLQSKSFSGKPSIFSFFGKVLEAHKRVSECKNELADAFYDLGTIDAFFSMAKLYKEHQDKAACYSFVTFVDSPTPVLKLVDFWNPFVDVETVVTNDVEVGTVDHPRNLLITGVNEGGKSTALKGVFMDIILAQTFGMVAARACQLTPFAKLVAHLNVIDDTADRTSLYKAEVDRAKGLLVTLDGLQEGEFMFGVLDEIFNATDPRRGEAGAYGIAKHIAKRDNSCVLLATHFSKLTDLEQDTNEGYHNYHVKADRLDDGSIVYPHKLFRGKSTQCIALDILEREGFDQSIIDDANSIL